MAYSSGNSETTPVSKRRARKMHHYAPALVIALGVIANAAAVADLFTRHIGFIGMVGAIITIVVGSYLFLGGWGKPVRWTTLLAVLVIVAGSVTLSLLLQKGGYISTGPTNHPSVALPSLEGEELKATNKVIDKGTKYVLNANESIDLDDGNQTILVQQGSAKAPGDLYFSNWGFLDTSVKDFYEYQPPRQSTGDENQDQYTACRNLIDTSELGIGSISSSSAGPDKVLLCGHHQGGAVIVEYGRTGRYGDGFG